MKDIKKKLNELHSEIVSLLEVTGNQPGDKFKAWVQGMLDFAKKNNIPMGSDNVNDYAENLLNVASKNGKTLTEVFEMVKDGSITVGYQTPLDDVMKDGIALVESELIKQYGIFKKQIEEFRRTGKVTDGQVETIKVINGGNLNELQKKAELFRKESEKVKKEVDTFKTRFAKWWSNTSDLKNFTFYLGIFLLVLSFAYFWANNPSKSFDKIKTVMMKVIGEVTKQLAMPLSFGDALQKIIRILIAPFKMLASVLYEITDEVYGILLNISMLCLVTTVVLIYQDKMPVES